MENVEVKPRFWIIISLLFLLLSSVIQIVVVISPNWFEVYCNNGTLILGLWQYCGDPLKASLTNNTEDTQAAIIDLFGYKQETQTCKALENYLFLGEDRSPVWFYTNRTLQCFALAASVLSLVLLVIYTVTPRPFVFEIVRGFAVINFTIGGFILVGLFIVAGKNNYVWEVVSSSYGCVEEGTKTGACIFLSLGSAVCAWTSAIILTIICLIERYKRREGGLFATARKGNGKKSLHSTKTYGINIVMTPRRLRATCNHQPNIKFITAERHLSFDSSSGEVELRTPSWSGSDLSRIQVNDMKNSKVYESGDLTKALEKHRGTATTNTWL